MLDIAVAVFLNSLFTYLGLLIHKKIKSVENKHRKLLIGLRYSCIVLICGTIVYLVYNLTFFAFESETIRRSEMWFAIALNSIVSANIFIAISLTLKSQQKSINDIKDYQKIELQDVNFNFSSVD